MGFNSLGMITIQKIITLLLPYYLFTLIICMLCHKPINGTPRAVRHHLSKHYRIPQGTQFRIANELQTEIAGFLWISWCRGWFIVVVARYVADLSWGEHEIPMFLGG